MRTSKVLGYAVVLSALCAVSTAQTVPEMRPRETILWPSALGTPPVITRCVAGHITSLTGRPDVVMLAGTNPLVYFQMGDFNAPTSVPRAAYDVDIAEGAGIDGLSAVVGVNNVGLEVIRFDPSTQSYTAVSVHAGPWAGAVKVRSADLDGNGSADYVGVGSDLRTIIVSLNGTTQTPWSVSDDVLDLLLLRWDGSTPRRIALLTTAGVEVRQYDGTLMDSYPNGGTAGGVIAKGRGATRDWIAFACSFSGTQKITRLRRGASPETWQSLPAIDVYAIAAADADLDGDEDLTMFHHLHAAPYYVEFLTGSNPAFDVPNATYLDEEIEWPESGTGTIELSSISTSANQATGIFADVMGTTRPDLVLSIRCTPASTTTNRVAVIEGIGIDTLPVMTPVFFYPLNITREENNPTVTFAVDTKYLDEDQWPESATHLFVRVWRQTQTNGVWTMHSHADDAYVIEAANVTTTNLVRLQFDITAQVGEEQATVCNHSSDIRRYVELDPAYEHNGQYVCVGEKRVLLVATAEDTGSDGGWADEEPPTLVVPPPPEGYYILDPVQCEGGGYYPGLSPRRYKPGYPTGSIPSWEIQSGGSISVVP